MVLGQLPRRHLSSSLVIRTVLGSCWYAGGCPCWDYPAVVEEDVVWLRKRRNSFAHRLIDDVDLQWRGHVPE